jgi:hypothetical protein
MTFLGHMITPSRARYESSHAGSISNLHDTNLATELGTTTIPFLDHCANSLSEFEAAQSSPLLQQEYSELRDFSFSSVLHGTSIDDNRSLRGSSAFTLPHEETSNKQDISSSSVLHIAESEVDPRIESSWETDGGDSSVMYATYEDLDSDQPAVVYKSMQLPLASTHYSLDTSLSNLLSSWTSMYAKLAHMADQEQLEYSTISRSPSFRWSTPLQEKYDKLREEEEREQPYTPTKQTRPCSQDGDHQALYQADTIPQTTTVSQRRIRTTSKEWGELNMEPPRCMSKAASTTAGIVNPQDKRVVSKFKVAREWAERNGVNIIDLRSPRDADREIVMALCVAGNREASKISQNSAATTLSIPRSVSLVFMLNSKIPNGDPPLIQHSPFEPDDSTYDNTSTPGVTSSSSALLRRRFECPRPHPANDGSVLRKLMRRIVQPMLSAKGRLRFWI